MTDALPGPNVCCTSKLQLYKARLIHVELMVVWPLRSRYLIVVLIVQFKFHSHVTAR